MLKIIKTSFNITNKYVILATPLIIFMLLASFYIVFTSSSSNPISLLISAILFFLMLATFISGWTYMLKEAVMNTDREDGNSIISLFPSGVGENFLPILGAIAVMFTISIIFLTVDNLISMKFIGNMGIEAEALLNALASPEATQAFINSLSQEQILKFIALNLIFTISIAVESFLLIFYIPAILFKNKNIFKAFWINLKDLFSKKFFKNLLLFIMICLIYLLTSLANSILRLNIITHFIFMLINFYFLVYIAVIIFNYYYNNYVRIGGEIDKTI